MAMVPLASEALEAEAANASSCDRDASADIAARPEADIETKTPMVPEAELAPEAEPASGAAMRTALAELAAALDA
jgi:hypothetical protein